MRDKLLYNGFIGTVHFSGEDNVFFGKIEGINDLVTFEADSVAVLREAFEEACEDYMQICKDAGKNPFKSYNGSFNIRIPSELHRKLAEKAFLSGLPINRVIQKAIEREVSE